MLLNVFKQTSDQFVSVWFSVQFAFLIWTADPGSVIVYAAFVTQRRLCKPTVSSGLRKHDVKHYGFSRIIIQFKESKMSGVQIDMCE